VAEAVADITVHTIQAAIHIQADHIEGRQDLHTVHRVRHTVLQADRIRIILEDHIIPVVAAVAAEAVRAF
jgi:hypothetical protein